MKYDKNAIFERVGKRKKKFLTLSALFLAVLFTCCAIMIFTDGNGLFFSAMLIAAATVFIAFRTLKINKSAEDACRACGLEIADE
ncbi:MAG: hypothetical protein IKM18_00380 [Clostridia bacterium]|nr:hypothetical protein [Clostridia bacterium]MBR3714345.1 hypothetical protein [Clostridia bacterium]